MKISLTVLLTLLVSLTFLGCNANTSKGLDSEAHQQASTTTTRGFPAVRRPANDVNCRNCYATFKLSRATQKQSHGHSYVACPVCNKDYLKKAK
jgi:hypothetical protein